MEPLTMISTALASIKGAVDITKSIRDLKSASDNVELKEQLIHLREALIESKEQILEVKEVLQDKDTKIKELEERLERDLKLIFNEALGCLEADENGKTVRYCLNCHTDAKYVPLKAEGSRFVCMVCGKKYQNGSGVSVGVCSVRRG